MVAQLLDRYRALSFPLQGPRDIPLTELWEDSDPQFRPSRELLAQIAADDDDPTSGRPVWSMDRPILPLVNACFKVGAPTVGSCAGHAHDYSTAPHLLFAGCAARDVAVLRAVARAVPLAHLAYTLDVKLGLRGREHAGVRWGYRERVDPHRSFDMASLRQFDEAALRGSASVLSLGPALPCAGAPSPEQSLLRRVGTLAGSRTFADLPAAGAWSAEPTLDGFRELLRVSISEADLKDRPLALDEAPWRLRAIAQRKRPNQFGQLEWFIDWEWIISAEAFEDLCAAVESAMATNDRARVNVAP